MFQQLDFYGNLLFETIRCLIHTIKHEHTRPFQTGIKYQQVHGVEGLLRKHKAEGLKVRCVNVLFALDDSHSKQLVAEIFYLDPDTLRRAFENRGMV